MVFENGVKNIQAAAYNGARTVFTYLIAMNVICVYSLIHDTFFKGLL